MGRQIMNDQAMKRQALANQVLADQAACHQAMEDNHERLERMRARGLECRAAAVARRDEGGFMLWDKTVSRIERALIISD